MRHQLSSFRPGEVLVADTTTPDWEPVMKTAAAIVTNRGGRTCHAAIVARELGIPAVVGAERATTALSDGQTVTVSCAEGDTGKVYHGAVPFQVERIDLSRLPRPQTRIMVNLGNPDLAFQTARLPVDGVGLARMEFIISRVHQGAPDGPRPSRARRGRGGARPDHPADPPLSRRRRLLRRAAVGGNRHHRRRLLPASRDRPHVGLQDQRIRQPDRRALVRAGRGKPDAGFPGRLALRPSGL